jgi:hypothetical protein
MTTEEEQLLPWAEALEAAISSSMNYVEVDGKEWDVTTEVIGGQLDVIMTLVDKDGDIERIVRGTMTFKEENP